MMRSVLIIGLLLSIHSLEARELHSQAPPMQLASINRGLELARQMCGDCHAVERGRASPNAEAPPFLTVANTRGMSIGALRVFFQTPHRMMPNLMLDQADADDVIDYILSLKSP